MDLRPCVRFILSLLWFSFVYKTECACTWPSDFSSSTWVDSEKGGVVFQTSTLTGFAFTVGATTVSEWECFEFGNDSSYIVMKTTGTFVQFVVNVYEAYRCLQVTKVTDASYRYYQIDPIQSANVGYERLTIKDTALPSDTSDLCDTNAGSSGSEYRMLLKSGSENSSRVTCPYSILADYSYTYSGSDGSVTCDSSTDVGQTDMCTDNKQLTFQYPACTSLTVYSASTTVWCADVVNVDSATCVTLYNGEQSSATIDNTNTFIFSCVCISTDGTQASVTPQYCKQNQTAGQIPAAHSGSSVGAVLALTRVGAPCPTLTAPTLGSVAVATDGSVTMATYTCDAGYTISGDGTRVCQSNGTWSGNTPSCTCAIPNAPANGSVTLSSDGLTLTYSCDVGTVLNGVTTRTCQTDSNTWTDTAPSCDVCQTLSLPADGSYAMNSTGTTSEVTYSCDVGFSLSGDVTRTCQTDTTWDNTAPTCTACPSLSNPDSGTVTISTNGLVSIGSYSCAAGYSIVGVDISVCTGGVWNSSAPTCVCETPSSPANGSVSVSSDGVTVTYACDVGFTLSGQRVLTCQTGDSGWDSAFPTCVECTSLTSPANGSLTLSSNGTLTSVAFSCDVGFTISGSASSECLTNGSWSTATPTCTQCDTLSVPASGSLVFTTDGTTTSALYSCNVGSTLSGDVTVECDSSGSWMTSDTNASCVSCQNLTSTAGSYELTSNGTTTSAELMCQSGYSLSGTSTVTCLADGTWSSSTSSCVIDSTDKGDDQALLPAVIALVVVNVLLLAAFIAALVYIYRQRRAKQSLNNQSPSPEYDRLPDKTPDPVYILGKMLNEAVTPSIAPSGHQHHVVVAGSQSMSRAPSSHAADGRHSSTTPRSVLSAHSSLMSGPITPRSLLSSESRPVTPRSALSASFAKEKLDLVKETTSSSLIMDASVPAPWNNQRKKNHANTTIGKNPRSPRHRSFPNEKPDIGTNPLIPQKPSKDDLKLDLSTPRDDSAGHKRMRKRSPRSPRKERRSPRKGHRNILVSRPTANGEITLVKDITPKSERATTPVNHALTVKSAETPRTPRSGFIANVDNP